MKKFSVLSLAVLMSAGMGFAGRTLPTGKILADDAKQMLNVPRAAEEILGKAAMAKAPMKIPVSEKAVSGTYTWNNRNLNGMPTPKTLEVELVDAATGKVEITGWADGCDFKVVGNVDFLSGVLSIPNNQYIGDDYDGFPNYFYVKDADEDGYVNDGVADVEATEGYYDGDSFAFPTADIWAIGDPTMENLGFWVMTYSNDLVMPFDEVQEGMWESVGPCTIEDAWITPSYTIDNQPVNPSDYLFTADLQRSVYDENLYRVWAPYWGEDCILSYYNDSAYEGQIVFDISDPERVIVKAGYYAGFDNANGEFCVFGMLGWQINTFGNDWDPSFLPVVCEFMEQRGLPFDTFKDNVLTVNLSMFDFDITCPNGYTWIDNPYVVSKITFPSGTAVSGVEVENAPVKYYNLQGVEVANPAAGELVICRQGDKATKKIMK